MDTEDDSPQCWTRSGANRKKKLGGGAATRCQSKIQEAQKGPFTAMNKTKIKQLENINIVNIVSKHRNKNTIGLQNQKSV